VEFVNLGFAVMDVFESGSCVVAEAKATTETKRARRVLCDL
jgi:hypothetical protein